VNSLTREQICEAFCRDVNVRHVPVGLAVSTPFEGLTGDLIGFYVVASPGGGSYRIEDDGTGVAFLEALGVSMSKTRSALFDALLAEYGLHYDTKSGEIHTDYMSEDSLPAASLRFVAMMLRLQDFGMLSPETVRTTFQEDAVAAIQKQFAGVDVLRFGEPVSERFPNYLADVFISAKGQSPVTVFFGTSDNKVNEAVLLWMDMHLTHHVDSKVVLMLETARPVGLTERVLARAFNHLDNVAVFRGEEKSAMMRLEGAVYGQPTSIQ